MPHFWVDDGWHKNRKRIMTGMDLEGFAARGLWLDAGSWCCDELTDGWVPAYMIDYLAPGIGRDLAKRLERARLWESDVRNGEDGWQYHDWKDFQLMRSEVLAQRQRKTDGGVLGNHRRWHSARGKVDPTCRYCTSDRYPDRSTESGGNRPDDQEAEWPTPATVPTTNVDRSTDRSTDRTTDGHPDRMTDQNGAQPANVDRSTDQRSDRSTESGPIPPVPVPIPIPQEQRAEDQTLFLIEPSADEAERPKSTKLPDTHRFDEFWEAYPHKRDKDAGRKAWSKVVRDSQKPGVDWTLDDVISGAGFYRFSKEFVGGFAKYPATFLNKGSWRDFAAGPPPEIQPPPVGGFDARAAEFDQMRGRFREHDTDTAAALIRADRPALTRGDPHA